MTIRLGGLVSGMDTDTTVKKLMSVEQTKLDTYYQKKQLLEWKRDDYREINTKLLALRNSTFNLKLDSTFDAKKVEISDDSVLSATASSDAPNGTHILKVNSLLNGVTKISTTELAAYQNTLAAQFGLSGTVSFELKGKDGVSHVYSYDTTAKSINDVVADINANTDTTGIRAYYSADGNRFTLATQDKGASEKIEVVADGNQFLENTLKLGVAGGNTYSGTNASVDYDGATGIEFASNQFTLNEINYNLKKAGETITVTVSQDVDTAVDKIKAWVESYNALMENFTTKLSEKRYYDYPPLTDEQKDAMSDTDIEKWEAKARSGVLKGESLLQSTASNIRMIASQVLADKVSSDYISDSGDLVNTLAPQVETALVSGTVTTAGNLSVTVKAAGMTASPKTISVAVLAGDTASVVAGKVKTALAADTDVSGFFNVAVDSANVVLTARNVADNDDTMNISIVNDTSAGIINSSVSQNTTAGSAVVSNVEYKSLASIGITTAEYYKDSTDNGKLYINETELRAALENNSEDVMKLFNLVQTEVKTVTVDGIPQQQTTDYNVGLGAKLYEALSESITDITNKAGLDSAYYDNSLIAKEIARIDDRIDQQIDRMTDMEDRYWSQFSAMEEAMQKLNEQSTWLLQKLGISTSES